MAAPIESEDVPEYDCEGSVAAQGEPENVDADADGEARSLLLLDPDEAGQAVGPMVNPALGPPGGRWGGAEHPIDRAIAIGRKYRVPLYSRKRANANPGSDHHPGQTRSDACDLSNGNSPTPEMDRTARHIAALLGHRNWGYGNLVVNTPRYRVQLLYRTYVGGNHFNHVHVGVRMR